MRFSFFSVLSTLLFAFAIAAPTAGEEDSSLAKRGVTGTVLLSQVTGLISQCKTLHWHAIQCKSGSYGPGTDFTDAANSCASSANDFKSACQGYNIWASPIAGLVAGLLELIACIIDLVVTLAAWILIIGIAKAKLLCTVIVGLLLCILDGISFLCGGNFAFLVLGWHCSQAKVLIKGCATVWGVSF